MHPPKTFVLWRSPWQSSGAWQNEKIPTALWPQKDNFFDHAWVQSSNMQLSLEFWAVCFSSFTPEVWCRESGWFCTALRRTKLRRVGEYWCEQFGQCLFEGFLQKQSLSAETRRSFMCRCIIHSASAGGYNHGSERICCVEALRQGTIYCSGQQCREDAGWSRPWVCESGQSERQCHAIFFALLCPFVLFCSFNSLDYWKGLKSWEDLRRVTALWLLAQLLALFVSFSDSPTQAVCLWLHHHTSSSRRWCACSLFGSETFDTLFRSFQVLVLCLCAMLCNAVQFHSILRKLKTIKDDLSRKRMHYFALKENYMIFTILYCHRMWSLTGSDEILLVWTQDWGHGKRHFSKLRPALAFTRPTGRVGWAGRFGAPVEFRCEAQHFGGAHGKINSLLHRRIGLGPNMQIFAWGWCCDLEVFQSSVLSGLVLYIYGSKVLQGMNITCTCSTARLIIDLDHKSQ